MKVAILGFSLLEQSENLPLYRYFKAQNAEITAFYWGDDEFAKQMPADITKVNVSKKALSFDEAKDLTFDDLEDFDLIVRSPVIHPNKIKTSKPVTTLYNIFMEACPCPVIGITGTKGKGTTSTLIAKILEAAGLTVHLGGNIGKPLLDDLPNMKIDDMVVYELSSFQLIDARFGPQIGVCVMVVPEHLDWHADTTEYFEAKANLFKQQSEEDMAVYNFENGISTQCVNASPGLKIPYSVPLDPAALPGSTEGVYVAGDEIFVRGQAIAKTSDVALLGRHNLENVCAAIAATWDVIDGDVKAILSVIKSFRGLEHRLEFVRELDGVQYINDTFATTPETSIAAMRAFDQPKVVILGGYDKGIPFDAVAREVIKSNVRHVVAIGNTGPTITKLIEQYGEGLAPPITNLGHTTMPEIVKTARQQAQPGDVVLLSTACASFDMFKSYKERGEQFKATVQALA